MSERASVPMSPLPSPPPVRGPQPTMSGESDAQRALRIALDVRERLGSASDPVRETKATGLVGLVLDLSAKVEHLDASVAKLTAAIDADRAARVAEAEALTKAAEKRREPWSKLSWIVITAAVGLAMAGGGAALATYVAKHWVLRVGPKSSDALAVAPP